MASTATEAAAAKQQQQQANGNGEQKTRHSEVGHKSLLKSDDLYQVRAPAVSVIRSIRRRLGLRTGCSPCTSARLI
jgi:hypothetical protein